ncbi:MAG TPA: hypothetical protein VNK43_10580 [Gemmatimonadales bacterium]|nr:hypothetical protein [Gemmatimonadales bacterium]
MLVTLALRHLLLRPARSLFLLLGYGLGVAVMIVLLSVGEAMLEQSRDVSLIGGGEVTVLPQGIDIEAMRTGGVSGMFFTIDRARFLTRQVLGGPRRETMISAVSPLLENKLVYLRRGGRTVAARAGGEIPSRAAAVGARIRVLDGAWLDSPADSAYVAPSAQRLYDELDRFHLPPVRDSTWAEWHYFNVATGPDEWWYITYLVGGEVDRGRWGGRLLVTRRSPDGRYRRFTAGIPADAIAFDTARADLTLGGNAVVQRDGVYRLRGAASGPAGRATFDLALIPGRHRYFPPALLAEGELVSGYAVPALRATVSGRLCVAGRCAEVRDAPGYHDHNWGVWRDVTWDWGAARGGRLDVLYGAVHAPDRPASGAPPYFVMIVDSLGLKQVLRAREIRYAGLRSAAGEPGARAPSGFELLAARDRDTVRMVADVRDALATGMRRTGGRVDFLQMRGRFRLEGRVAGEFLADTGWGFFETYLER